MKIIPHHSRAILVSGVRDFMGEVVSDSEPDDRENHSFEDADDPLVTPQGEFYADGSRILSSSQMYPELFSEIPAVNGMIERQAQQEIRSIAEQQRERASS